MCRRSASLICYEKRTKHLFATMTDSCKLLCQVARPRFTAFPQRAENVSGVFHLREIIRHVLVMPVMTEHNLLLLAEKYGVSVDLYLTKCQANEKSGTLKRETYDR